MNGDDVGVGEVCGGSGFLQEPRLETRFLNQVRAHDFDRDLSLEIDVASPQHIGHATRANSTQDFVTTSEQLKTASLWSGFHAVILALPRMSGNCPFQSRL